MPTEAKIQRVDELKDKLERSSIAVAADYTGISVNGMTDLRRRMRAAGVDLTVVKNTLTYLASDAAGRPQVKEIVQGPTVMAFGYDDPQDVAPGSVRLYPDYPLILGHPWSGSGRRAGVATGRRDPTGKLALETSDGSHLDGPVAVTTAAFAGGNQRPPEEPGCAASGEDSTTGIRRIRRLDLR